MDRRNFLRTGSLAMLGSLAVPSLAMPASVRGGTEKTVSQIAYELGFQYSQHFNRIFKKNTGYTPGEYRKLQI